MTWQAWLTLAVLGAVLGLMTFTRYAADLILLAAVTLLLIAGVIDTEQALHGLANEGVVTIGVLFIVAAGLRDTGGMHWITNQLLGRPGSLTGAQTRIMVPVAVMSAFMNNTPLVAMLMPVVADWARKLRYSASKLMIPLSYASIFGGACTLIGTSTNLIVNGWLIDEIDHPGLGMFTVAAVGLPVAIVGIGFVLLTARWLLPDRGAVMGDLEDPREYTVEVTVEPDGPMVGRTVEQAGLRNLPGLYLVEIERDGEIRTPVGPEEILQAGDRLVFAGVVESVVDLHNTRGLKPATDQVFKLDAPRNQRCLIEAVVSNTSPLAGHTVREVGFRSKYNAAVIAVARNGERIERKIGDIRMRPGDTLLLETKPDFVDQQRNNRDFFLVSRVSGSTPLRHEKAPLAVLILAGMVLAVTAGWLSMLQAAMLAAGLMIAGRCTTASSARTAVDWSVLIVIAAALGLGSAMSASGLADQAGQLLLTTAGSSPWLALALMYGLTMVLASVVTSKAAAVLVLPIAAVAAERLQVDLMPFVIAVMIASATTVATPIGYPTNLMVLGPGGYRFTDYLRIGVPLSLLIWGVTILITPWFFPF